jgi:hypothetical protein
VFIADHGDRKPAVVTGAENRMSASTDRWARWVMAGTAGIFALSAAMLGGDAKMLLIESLELAFLIGCAAACALLILGMRTRWLIVLTALMFTLFITIAIYESDQPITPKMLLLEVLELAFLTVITALVVRCMRTELARP